MSRQLAVVLILLILAFLVAFPATTKPLPLSFCDVLQNLSKYRGKVIEVKGEWISNTIGKGECAPLKIGSYTWINAFTLKYPTAPESNNESDVYWTLNSKELDKAENQAIALRKSGPSRIVTATFIGRLDTKEHLEMLGQADGFDRPQPDGFGHLNQYPAELVVIAIKDIRTTSPGGR